MRDLLQSVGSVSDEQLIKRVQTLCARRRSVEAELLAVIGEIDERKLYLDLAFPSMHAYCMEFLHLSEAQTYHRIHVARGARRFPVLLEAIRSGDLHLSGAALLVPHMTEQNAPVLILAATHRSKRFIERMLADRNPSPDAPDSVRRLPEPSRFGEPGSGGGPRVGVPSLRGPLEFELARCLSRAADAAAALPPLDPPNREDPLGEGRFRIQFTASPKTVALLAEVKSLLRHQIPNGDLGAIFERALDVLHTQLKKERFALTNRPRPRKNSSNQEASRHVPAEVRRQVYERDSGSCTFVGDQGRRCGSRDFLEFHHLDPWARTQRHDPARIVLRCRAHNQHAAIQDYGPDFMKSKIAGASPPPGEAPEAPAKDAKELSNDHTTPPTGDQMS